MVKRSRKTRRGVTLIELMIVVLIVTLLMIAVGTTMASSQDSWNQMYKRSYSGPVTGGLIVAKEFDRAVRKATVQQCDTDGTTYLRVYYYKQPDPCSPGYSTDYDGYTKFYYVANEKRLKVDEGDAVQTAGVYGPTGNPMTRTIAEDVQSCVFRVPGTSVEMVLRLDASQNTDLKDGNIQMTVTCSAVRHNL